MAAIDDLTPPFAVVSELIQVEGESPGSGRVGGVDKEPVTLPVDQDGETEKEGGPAEVSAGRRSVPIFHGAVPVRRAAVVADNMGGGVTADHASDGHPEAAKTVSGGLVPRGDGERTPTPRHVRRARGPRHGGMGAGLRAGAVGGDSDTGRRAEPHIPESIKVRVPVEPRRPGGRVLATREMTTRRTQSGKAGRAPESGRVTIGPETRRRTAAVGA